MEEGIEFQIKSVKLSSQVKLPYAEQGGSTGVPVIFLHGFLDSRHSFARVLPYLPESIHAFAVAQRGHSDASRPTAGYGIIDFANDLEAFMDALKLATAVIVGHSMGSAVASRFVIDHPERVAGLVLIGASSNMRVPQPPGVSGFRPTGVDRSRRFNSGSPDDGERVGSAGTSRIS